MMAMLDALVGGALVCEGCQFQSRISGPFMHANRDVDVGFLLLCGSKAACCVYPGGGT